MNIKYILIIFISVLILISILQIFSIPPYAEDIFKVYKSGYFVELEKGCEIIKDSFLDIKMMSKPVYGWIFVSDMKKKHGISIKVFDYRGREVTAPGEIGNFQDDIALLAIKF